MNTIIVNTLTGAVSEYTSFPFQSITPTHAGSSTGLYELAGDNDNGTLIVSRIQTGLKQWSGSLKKFLSKAFFGLTGDGAFLFHVSGEATDYEYPIPASASGMFRSQPGRGIRETYLSYGFSNPDGQDFQLDTIEVVDATSTSRRV